MKEELIKIITENLGIVVSTGTTILLAWIKKKLDMRKWKKEGRLIDISKQNYNGKAK